MKIESFLGVRNTSPPRSIPNNALALADNIDVDDSGILVRRPGHSLSKSASITSAYSTQDQQGYVISGGKLCRVDESLGFVQIADSTATEFSDFQKVLFTNDGLMVETDVAANLKLPSPPSPLSLSHAPGSLQPGSYSATYAYKAANGMEGGTAPIATIGLATVGGIYIDPPTVPSGYTARVYVTECNGTVYYADNGSQLSPVQLLADAFPDNVENLAYFNSRLYLSQLLPTGQSVVWFSQPSHFHLYDYGKGYFLVQGHIRAMMGANGALLIGTDSNIYAYTDGTLTELAGYGIPKGRAFCKMPNGTVMVHSKRGTCEALPFVNHTETKCLFTPGDSCSTALVEQGGISRFVAINDGLGESYNKRF